MGKWNSRRKREDDKKREETDELAKALREMNIDKLREIVERRKFEEYENGISRYEASLRPEESLKLKYLEILNNNHHTENPKITNADMARSKLLIKSFKDNPQDCRKIQRKKKQIKSTIKRCRCKK